MSAFDTWAFEQCALNGDTITGVKGDEGINTHFVNERTGEKFYISGCRFCGAKEIEAMTPRTVYSCGTSSYDDRLETFKRGEKCA